MSSDKRQVSQPVLMVTHVAGEASPWTNTTAFKNQVVGTLPLVPVSQMIGYDADSKPGAAARVEQCLDIQFTTQFLFDFLLGAKINIRFQHTI